MPLDLHLFATPGIGDDIDWVVEACRPYIEDRPKPSVAYLPLASLFTGRLAEDTQKAFGSLAKVETINTEEMELAEMESILRRAAVAYIPGGNTFLLGHRLHLCGLLSPLRKKIQSGLPLVGVSAGTVLCGPNVLTSNDLNMMGTPHFEGLKLLPFNFNVHYAENAAKDEWLADYRSFHDNPLIMMGDDAYIRAKGKTTTLVRGEAWIWHAGCEKERLEAGQIISPLPGGKE
jgi:dipeptidase E